VKHISKSTYRVLILSILISLLLGGCFTLSDDITPPPGGPRPTLATVTQEIRPTSTQPAAQPAADSVPVIAGDGSVRIEIIDSAGAALQEGGLEVQLEGYKEYDLKYQETQSTGDLGQVFFSDVPLVAGQFFFASITYRGAVYRSNFAEITEDTNSLDLFIQVFDTTTDRSGLVTDRVHVLLELLEPDLINVVEIFIISNLGDKTIIASAPGEPAVIFPLPEGAASIEFDDGALGGRYLLTDEGFGDTASIPPGSSVYQVLVYYTLPYKRNKIDFEQEMLFPVGAVVVMVPSGNIKVTSPILEDMGVQNIPGGAVQVFAGAPIQQNQLLEFRLSGKPPGAAEEPGEDKISSPNLVIVLGVFGGLLFLTGIFLFIRNRRGSDDDDLTEEGFDDQDQILDSILALEDIYKKGEISKKVYQKKRAELKDQLNSSAGK
jgi:hypothetical protein